MRQFGTRQIIIILITILLLSAIIASQELESFIWTEKKAKIHIKNRTDPSKWNTAMLKEDLEFAPKTNTSKLPFEIGIYPTPEYDLVENKSFRGLGNYGFLGNAGRFKKIGERKIVYNTFFVAKNKINSKFVGNKNSDVFFRILVLAGSENAPTKDNYASFASSRNHPHYLGQGMFKSENGRIDYTAFITADRNAYAIVNMRLFDLKYGRTILIAPRKDKSLRSLQLKDADLSMNEIELAIDELLERPRVREFFTETGNI